ncbi:MAG: hypothetical protein P8Z00_07630 [Anaerolineales bacterium]|jgi:hypothetical protein
MGYLRSDPRRYFLRSLLLASSLTVAVCLVVFGGSIGASDQPSAPGTDIPPLFLPFIVGSGASQPPVVNDQYIILGWNDLGMHCYNRDFKDLAVLPPYNTLWAQVVLRGDPPEIITSTVTVKYSFPDNTYSVGKTNFWDYAQQLFNVSLAPNVGLAGKGLSGEMDQKADHFVAEGIPLTEYDDSDLNTRQPYQLATLVVYDRASGKELARNQIVAPVSTEMHCDYCHSDNGEGNEEIATGVVEQNILTAHDREHQSEYPAGHSGSLMSRRPVLCAECHSSNALGAPGVAGVPSLSHAIHSLHAEEVSSTLEGCYSCHPGPKTQCLRDVMSQRGMTCIDCHGGLDQVKLNPDPWLNEPRCSDCHKDPKYAQNQALYRQSSGHGGLYCEACHDSTHAIAQSREPRDAIKFVNLQGHPGTLETCTVCHLSQPQGISPHQ